MKFASDNDSMCSSPEAKSQKRRNAEIEEEETPIEMKLRLSRQYRVNLMKEMLKFLSKT